ncbi:MAG: serine hydrolase domain-containing protein [Brevirhabdus sp.]
MKKQFRIGAWVLGILTVCALVIGIWKREEITRLMAVNSLFDEDRIVTNFSSMDHLFLTRKLSRGEGPVSELPTGKTAALLPAVTDWITERNVTAMIVMKDGQIVSEEYYNDTGIDDLRISWSVAKSWLSALFGILEAEGSFGSLDDKVTVYAPELQGSAYQDVTVRQVLNMTSGVAFNEDYLDFNSDINKMGRVLALGRTMDGFAAGLRARDAEPGERWQYVSIDTHIVGMVIRGATGRDVGSLIEEKLIQPMGLRAAPYYVTDGVGVAFVLGGLNMTTRDYARLGQLFLDDGYWNGQQIVPTDWVHASTKPQAPTLAGKRQYGYQWWMPADAREGEFFAHGIYGQYIYVNRQKGVVITVNAADRGFRDHGVSEANIEIFRQIADSL